MKDHWLMAIEEKKNAIQSYIAAYNGFDIDGMVALIHPKVVFEYVSGGEVNVKTMGAEQFRELANKSKGLFSIRHQQATNFKFTGDIVTVNIAYEGVLAVNLPNGMKAGELLRLNGPSSFEFKDGKIFRITDFS